MVPSQHDHHDPSSPDHSPENEEPDTTSPESAALARGAARTAASAGGRSATTAATRGAIAGRLPVAASSRTAAKGAASKAMIARAPKISAPRPAPSRVVVARSAPRNFPKAHAPRTASSLPKVPRPVRAPRVQPPRSSPKLSSSRIPKARANTIARASDRASKGLDALNAGLDQNHSAESNNAQNNAKHSSRSSTQTMSTSQILKSITPVLQKITSFGKIFITNAILGMAVFATYEGLIESIAPSSVEETRTDGRVKDNNSMLDNAGRDESETDSTLPQLNNYRIEGDNDAMDRATLPQHFLAGAMGGAAHAVLSLALEVKWNVSSGVLQAAGKWTNHTFTNVITQKPIHFQVPALNYSTSSILHHSLAHSVLFGSYQLTKRLFLQCIPSSDSTNNPNSGNNDTIHISSIAMAGGLAGQFQHVTSHFTEQWLGLADETKNSSSSLLRRLTFATWPTWRSTMLAFPPSAIGFLAFEYGKLMITREDHVDE